MHYKVCNVLTRWSPYHPNLDDGYIFVGAITIGWRFFSSS